MLSTVAGRRFLLLCTLVPAFVYGCGSASPPTSSPAASADGGEASVSTQDAGAPRDSSIPDARPVDGAPLPHVDSGATGDDGASSPLTARQKVMSYLASISGQKSVAGQHNKNNPTPTDGTDQVTSITGKAPGLWSADFGFGADDVAARPTMIAQAQTEWQKGSIVQLMYHNCVPTGDEDCTWDDIGGATPQHLTDAQWTDLVTDGGTLNAAWKARLDTLSVFFAQLQAAGVAPLFRPLHEMNQGVFWWAGRPGPTGTRRLYQITHDYLVDTKGFDNIVWVWDLQDFDTLSTDVADYDPGSSYYDIAALDVYDGGYDTLKYTTMQGAAGSKPIAIGECETLPTSAELTAQPDWVFFMLWPDFIAEDEGVLPGLYGAPNVVTLGQMPGW